MRQSRKGRDANGGRLVSLEPGFLPQVPVQQMRPESSNSAPGTVRDHRSLSAGRFPMNRDAISGVAQGDVLARMEARLLRLESENHDLRSALRQTEIRQKHALDSVEQRVQSSLQSTGFDGTKVQLEFEAMQRAYATLEGSMKQQLVQIQAARVALRGTPGRVERQLRWRTAAREGVCRRPWRGGPRSLAMIRLRA